MAKHSTGAALNTPDLLTGAKRRGRPPKADSMTNAQRQAKFRASRLLVPMGETMTATIARFAKDFDMTETEITRELIRFALTNRNWSQTGF